MIIGSSRINLELRIKGNSVFVVPLGIDTVVTAVLVLAVPRDDEIAGCVRSNRGVPLPSIGRRVDLEFITERVVTVAAKVVVGDGNSDRIAVIQVTC